MNTTVQKIFRQSFEDYTKHKKLPPHYYKSRQRLHRVPNCRYGWSHTSMPRWACRKYLVQTPVDTATAPNATKFRLNAGSTPRNGKLLDTKHRHLVFTVPHELNELWLMNSSLMTDLLFKAVSETLKELFSDKKYLGADTGFILNLHTWGRNLSLHPHLHCLITEGGLTQDGGNGSYRSKNASCRIELS